MNSEDHKRLGPDEKGATEDEMERIEEIKGDESLGYIGEGHEEHSGEPAVETSDALEREFADNLPGQIVKGDDDESS